MTYFRGTMKRTCPDEDTVTMRFFRKFRGGRKPSDRWVLFTCPCTHDTNSTTSDRLLLTPFHLYKKYHQFPFSVVLHIVLVIFISVNALMISSEYIGYGRANEQAFEAVFLPPSTRLLGLYSVPDTLDLISSTVHSVGLIILPQSVPRIHLWLPLF